MSKVLSLYGPTVTCFYVFFIRLWHPYKKMSKFGLGLILKVVFYLILGRSCVVEWSNLVVLFTVLVIVFSVENQWWVSLTYDFSFWLVELVSFGHVVIGFVGGLRMNFVLCFLSWPFWRLLKALGFRLLVLVFWLGLDLVVVYLMLYFGVLY